MLVIRNLSFDLFYQLYHSRIWLKKVKPKFVSQVLESLPRSVILMSKEMFSWIAEAWKIVGTNMELVVPVSNIWSFVLLKTFVLFKSLGKLTGVKQNIKVKTMFKCYAKHSIKIVHSSPHLIETTISAHIYKIKKKFE